MSGTARAKVAAISISQIPAQMGKFVLECSVEKEDATGRGFELRLDERRPASDADRARVRAERLIEVREPFKTAAPRNRYNRQLRNSKPLFRSGSRLEIKQRRATRSTL